MQDEIFDVVNDRDEVIGRETRPEVHRRKLLHRAVHVMVFNGAGNLFLQKRSMKKDNWPGVWDSSASGHLDAGEDYDACAVREVREEIGLQLRSAPTRLFKIDGCPETGFEFVWVYACRSEGPFVLHPEEIDRGDWFSLERIDEWAARAEGDFASGFLKIWRDVRLRGGWTKLLAFARV
jgi:isopentenyl-diphosphate delta-isomerase type 1